MKKAIGTTVFPLAITEYERGWGSRPDGYLFFLSEEDRAWFLNHDREEKDQTGDEVPDWYLSYNLVNPLGLPEHLANKISFTERVFKVGSNERTMFVAAT